MSKEIEQMKAFALYCVDYHPEIIKEWERTKG
jgi:hypothetical protein